MEQSEPPSGLSLKREHAGSGSIVEAKAKGRDLLTPSADWSDSYHQTDFPKTCVKFANSNEISLSNRKARVWDGRG